MKVKTAELTGRQLDAAVALAEGWTLVEDGRRRLWVRPITNYMVVDARLFHPSTDPVAGDPIIEREHISTVYMSGKWEAFLHYPGTPDHYLDVTAGDGDGIGATRLEAGMRAWVGHKLGAAFELPDHLFA